jgi:hypothetical protein
MSNYEIYAQSIDDAALTINTLDEAANYPIENMQDRCENTLWKCDTANTSGYIQIDLGTARAVNYVMLGNHNYTDTGKGIKVSYDNADAAGFGTELFAVGSIGAYHDYVSGNADRWLESFSSVTKRYWRVYLEAMGAATNQEIGTIFIGTFWNWAHEPELRMPDESGYNVNIKQSGGGSTFSQIANTTVRRDWGIPFEYIDSDEKGNCETFRDSIFMNKRGGLSRYPFYFTDDGETTFYFARAEGALLFEQQAYQIYKTHFKFVEEL